MYQILTSKYMENIREAYSIFGKLKRKRKRKN